MREDRSGEAPHPPSRLFAYDAHFVSANPDAPSLEKEIKDLEPEVSAAAAGTSLHLEPEERRTRQLVKMPWSTGPCRYILAETLGPPGNHWLPPTAQWLAPLGAVLLGLLVSAGPLIQRLRRLTRQVRQSAALQNSDALRIAGNDEIAELGNAFAEAHREVRGQQALQAKREAALREFLANTTHDVMIPLTALQGHLAKLEPALANSPDREEVKAAADETHYIAALLTNLSVVARLESGELSIRQDPVDMVALVVRATGRLSVIARQHAVTVEHGVPPEPLEIRGDVTLLEQAVGNILSNAILYNRAGGHVAVVLERSSKEFNLRIMDDGPGIPEAERQEILKRGFRSDAARSRAPSGQGLGLNIAQEVARRHGWTLALSTSEFGGLEVTLRGALPA
jgi:signal transduction histidine kinase